MAKDTDIDTRINEIDKYLEKLRNPDIRYKWMPKFKNWLESEGIPRHVANEFTFSLFLNSLCDDNYHEVMREIRENEKLDRLFKPWLEKYFAGQAQQPGASGRHI